MLFKRMLLLALSLMLLGLVGCAKPVTFRLAAFQPLTLTASPPKPPPPRPRPLLKITIRETIQFETGKAKIKERSYPILDEVVKVLKSRPDAKKVRIEGHTDSKGNAEKNRTLSQARAEAVLEYLVGKGIARERLEAKGYGPDNPIADNDTEEGRAKNRRVEFTVIAPGARK